MYLWDEGYISYNDQRRSRISNMISGAIFEVALDNTHPMAYGYPKNYNSLKIGASFANSIFFVD